MEAVDYEIEQLGATEQATAHDEAQWRLTPVTQEVSIAAVALSPREAQGIADALGYLLFAEHHNQGATEQASQENRALKVKRGWPKQWKDL